MENLSEAEVRRIAKIVIEEAADGIAEKAASKALDRVYADVGRSTVKKIFWIVGSLTIALLLFLNDPLEAIRGLPK